MEYSKIKDLLDLYFQGNTTLDQETSLRTYFYSEDVDDRLKPYVAFFNDLDMAAAEVLEINPTLPNKVAQSSTWRIAFAATVITILGVSGFMYSGSSKTIQEKEALAALKKSKEAMYLMASQFNKAAQRLSLVDEFQATKNKYLK